MQQEKEENKRRRRQDEEKKGEKEEEEENIKSPNIQISGSLKYGGGGGYLKNNDQSFPIFDENYKSIEPRSSMDPKYKKHEENYTKVYHNQIVPNQR